jgi:hypothetical protein
MLNPPLRALNEAEESVAVARRAWTQQDLRDVKGTTLVMSEVSAIMYPFTNSTKPVRTSSGRGGPHRRIARGALGQRSG